MKARNQVGFGGYAYSSQQSVGVPSMSPSINASVTGIRQILLNWIRLLDTGVGVGKHQEMTRFVVQRSYGDNTFAGCTYGTAASDNCAASTVGACCSDVSVSPTTLTALFVVPSIGPTYFFFGVMGQKEVGLGLEPTLAKEQGVGPPGPIGSMEITAIGPAQFHIMWTQVTNSGLGINNTDRTIHKFRLQICQDPVRDFSLLFFTKDFSGSTFEFFKYDFLGGRNYTFRVIAINKAGEGTPLVGITETAISLPSDPLNLIAVVKVPLQIDLSWGLPIDTGFRDATTAPLRGHIINITNSADGFSQ